MQRYVACVKSVLKQINFVGFPESITGVPPTPMPLAKWLVMEPGNTGVYLFRYDESREDAGDTWHPNEVEAREQAAYEFDLRPNDWIPVPDSVLDPLAFASSLEQEG